MTSDDRSRPRSSCGCCRRAVDGRAAGTDRAASPSRPSSPRGNAIAGPLLSAHEGVMAMEIGIYGLGRMGGNMATRLLRGGHRVVAGNRSAGPVDASKGDVLVDGGNSNFRDSMRRAEKYSPLGFDFLDIGVSGGIWGLEVGYCMMVGGPKRAVDIVRPALDTLAPPNGWAHFGKSGAGHFTKMVHNGIEYGMMQAYGEGFELLHASEFGLDLNTVAKVWMQGSVVRSWLLELLERAYAAEGTDLKNIKGWVADSGEGRWTVIEAINHDVPATVLAHSLFARFTSRQEDSYAMKVAAALRNQFGGHAVKTE